MKPVATLAPVYTGSKWSEVWQHMRDAFASRRMTNAEAVALIRVWRGATTSEGALWYQFAARAYGWNPPTRDVLTVSDAQAAAVYPATADLWTWSKGIADELDASNVVAPVSLAPNKDTFRDPAFYGEVRANLLGDGAKASLPTTGKRRLAAPSRASVRRSPIPTPLLILGVWWLLTRKQRRVRR